MNGILDILSEVLRIAMFQPPRSCARNAGDRDRLEGVPPALCGSERRGNERFFG